MGEEKSSSGAYVYIKDKLNAWVPGKLVSTSGGKAVVSVPQYPDEFSILSDGGKGATGYKEVTVNLKDYDHNTLPLQNVDAQGNLTQVDDMVDLPFLHEGAILYNIKERHRKKLPYTRTGDIVIAVNPYQWLTYLYSIEEQIKYSNTLVWDNHDGGDPRRLVAPHVYETSSLCYKGLAVDRQDQSILVSGESGAGKTETVKIAMNHIASVQRGKVSIKDCGEAFQSKVVARIVESNPLLESFGNAKTRRNDNSSRFGKYISLQFDRDEKSPEVIKPCRLAGSKCEVYLLEKSRICFHDTVERTYHIFYQLVNAPEKQKCYFWDELKGKNNESFAYVGYTDVDTIEGKKDGLKFEDTIADLSKVGVDGESLTTLMQAICAVLQLGQITFGDKDGDEDKSKITSTKEANALAKLLGVDAKDLDLALTERTVRTRGEEYKVPLNKGTAKDSADAFAKEIYARLFLWLVRAINDATCAELNFDGEQKSGFGMIGLLDIFGFESFPVNGFEQLSINYANEKLQQKFTQDIFRAVLEEYEFEGIDIADITYEDNTPVLNLIEGKGGFLAMLNEECVRPKGNDATFVNKAVTAMKKNPVLHHTPRMGPLDFGINHYAGPVQYFAQDFVTRNTDTLPMDLQELAKKTTNEIIAKHLTNDAMMNFEDKSTPAAKESKGPKRSKSSLTGDTVWTKFKTQLNSLMTNLSTTRSRYIRCVKPNTKKKKEAMQNDTTIDQLRCAGVVSAITITRSAYPNRLSHQEVIDRFSMLGIKGGGKPKRAGPSEDPKGDCDALMTKVLDAKRMENGKLPFAMGKTRCYFRAGALEFLESERAKIWDTLAVDIQRVIRGWWGRHQARMIKYAHLIQCAIPIQARWRVVMAKKEFERRKEARKRWKKMQKKQKKAALIIQDQARCWLTRQKFLRELEEKKAEMKQAQQLRDLEKNLKEEEEAHKKKLRQQLADEQFNIEDTKDKIREEIKAEMARNKKKNKSCDAVDESQKIIKYLRGQNTKFRDANDSMKKEFKTLKTNNQRLMEANASAGASFTALNDHAKQLSEVNEKLKKNVGLYKNQLNKMKDDLKMRQAYYLAEANARVIYQKTLNKIVANVKGDCSQDDLVDEIVNMAIKCEQEAKTQQLDAAQGRQTKSIADTLNSGGSGSAANSGSDSDSDSD